jgi:hypothetical protein
MLTFLMFCEVVRMTCFLIHKYLQFAPECWLFSFPGTLMPNGAVTSCKSKFEDKIEPSSAKMYFHYYGQLLHQQNMMQDYVRTG